MRDDMDVRLIIGDACDIVAAAVLSVMNVSEVLDWIYTGLLIASIILGIVLKITGALKDRKVTAEEAKEIKEEIEKGMEAIREQSEKLANDSADNGEKGEEDHGE